MHVVLKQRPETIVFKMHDGRVFNVNIIDGEAWLPNDLAQAMIGKGILMAGTAPDPNPQWETLPGGGYGDLIPKYRPWCKEIPRSDVNEPAQPEAISQILSKGRTKR